MTEYGDVVVTRIMDAGVTLAIDSKPDDAVAATNRVEV